MINQVRFYFATPSHAYLLKHAVECTPENSFSSILSAAAFILFHFPNIPCPLPFQPRPPNIIHQLNTQQFCLHPHFEPWCEFLCDCFKQQSAIAHEGTVYLQIKIGTDSEKLISLKNELFMVRQIEDLKKLSIRQRISELFGVPEPKEIRRVAFYNNRIPSRNQGPFVPKVNVFALIMGSIYNNQDWRDCHVLSGDYLSFKELEHYDCVILSGSASSVLDADQHRDAACQILFKAYKSLPCLKIIGICFGHQLISKIFGSKITKRVFQSGVHSVRVNVGLVSRYKFLQPLADSKEVLRVSEFHQDFVEDVPHGFDLLGHSSNCQVQGLVSHDSRILTVQFHCEYITEFLLNYYARIQLSNSSKTVITDKEKAKDSPLHYESSLKIRRCFHALIHSGNKCLC